MSLVVHMRVLSAQTRRHCISIPTETVQGKGSPEASLSNPLYNSSGATVTFATTNAANQGSGMDSFDSPEPTDGADAGTRVLANMQAITRVRACSLWGSGIGRLPAGLGGTLTVRVAFHQSSTALGLADCQRQPIVCYRLACILTASILLVKRCCNMLALQTSTREEWEINPDEVKIAKTADGRDHFLGGGGFGMVRTLSSLSLFFQHHPACNVACHSLPVQMRALLRGASQLSFPAHSTGFGTVKS